MSAIWRRESDEWRPLLPSGFANEAALHDLVADAPHLLPLSGDPSLVVVGREVTLGVGRADLLAVEADGRLVIIEIKLRSNADARRAVVAQVLMYAAFLKGIAPDALQSDILRPHFAQLPFDSLEEAASELDQTGTFDASAFSAGVAQSLAAGWFRLVLVLDQAPPELVQLVGYLESISEGVVLDLITVSAYNLGDEQILVPQRVDPEHIVTEVPRRADVGPLASSSPKPMPIAGTGPFEEATERAPAEMRATLHRLLTWAQGLEERNLASLKSVHREERAILLVWLPGEKAGLVTIWNDGGASVSLWRSVFVRAAWELIGPIESLTGKAMGQGTAITDPSPELLDLVSAAYERAATNAPQWDGRTFYVSFGDGHQRDWEDARKLGFVAAGGGAWYTKTLRGVPIGSRVFAYISKGNGVGGYVGYGEVTGEPRMAKDFIVEADDGTQRPITEVARVDMTRGGTTDPDMAEWLLPVRWIKDVARDQAIKDSDFFANQNSAVRLTHGYTLKRLRDAFEVEDADQ